MPKKVADKDRRVHQVTFRITEEQREVIRQAAHLERKGGINAYVFEVVEQHIEALKSNESVAALLRVQEEYDAGIAETTPMRRSGSTPASAETNAQNK